MPRTPKRAEQVAAQIERGLAEGSMAPGEGAAAEAEGLVELLETEIEFLANPAGFADRFAGQPLRALAGGRLSALTDGGYLATREQRALFLLINGTEGGLEGRRRLVTEVRSAAAGHGPWVYRFRVAGPEAR